MKILMVCLGNICRSPLADALLRQKVKDKNLNIEVDSCGTSAFHIGNPPDKRTQENARKHGLDMSFLRARQFDKSDFQDFDLIFAMDSENEYNILQLADSDEERAKVRPLLQLIPEEKYTEVPDPYYGGNNGFEVVYQLLDKATDALLEEISTIKI